MGVDAVVIVPGITRGRPRPRRDCASVATGGDVLVIGRALDITPRVGWNLRRVNGCRRPTRADDDRHGRCSRLGTEWRVLYRFDESKHAAIVQDMQHRSTAYLHRWEQAPGRSEPLRIDRPRQAPRVEPAVPAN